MRCPMLLVELIGTQGQHTFHFSARINEHHYRKEPLFLPSTCSIKSTMGFQHIVMNDWQFSGDTNADSKYFLKILPWFSFLTFCLYPVTGLRGSITTQKTASNLKLIISKVYIQVSRRKFGNEAIVLTNWKICVIQWYNKITTFLKKLLWNTQLELMQGLGYNFLKCLLCFVESIIEKGTSTVFSKLKWLVTTQVIVLCSTW